MQDKTCYVPGKYDGRDTASCAYYGKTLFFEISTEDWIKIFRVELALDGQY